MPRKITPKGLKKILDKLVSQYILNRDKKCVICGSTKQLGNGHLFSRINLATRWDVRDDGNCHAQCWPCNFLHSSRDSYPYQKWYIKKFGMKRFDKLYKEWNTVTRLNMTQLRKIRKESESLLDKKTTF